MYPYGMIGNCQVSALVSREGSIDWYCVPRPDSEPIFGRLLDPNGGAFSFSIEDRVSSQQRYIENTNVLETILTDRYGASISITDFAPRFEQYARMYRPPVLIRIVRPLQGRPRLQVSCRPINGWKKAPVQPLRGNSHIRFPGFADQLRLTTNAPLTYVESEGNFAIDKPMYFALTWGIPVESDLAFLCETYLQKTIDTWRQWVKHALLPSAFQQQVIRSALALKLHCYEDTGGILAAMTTSLPEELGNVRNWDYRYCWLRDACFTVSVFYRLGHFAELEGILGFLLNVLERSEARRLRPVYRIDGTLPLPETNYTSWKGFNGTLPIRVGNQAAEHVQNDVYGEVLLTLAPLYFDDKFSYMRSPSYDSLFRRLAHRAFDALHEPDAGLWEFRKGWKVHSFTQLTSWAGLDRYERLVKSYRMTGDLSRITAWRTQAENDLRAGAVDGSVRNSPGSSDPDSALLLMGALRFPDQALLQETVNYIRRELGVVTHDNRAPAFLYRYKRTDDFGTPKHPFLICTFWLIEALVRLGHREDAMQVLETSLISENHVGLMAEHFDPFNLTQTGNFPQCYSHVGLINAAFAVSDPWSDIL